MSTFLASASAQSTCKAALAQTEAFLDRDGIGYVCVTGVHGIIEAQDDGAFCQILNESFLTTPDGMPTVWIGRQQGFRGHDTCLWPGLHARSLQVFS